MSLRLARTAIIMALALLLWLAAKMLLCVFAGILLALLLRGPAGLDRVRRYLDQSSWRQSLVSELQPGNGGISARAVAGRFFGIASSTIGVVVGAIVVLFIGLYGALDPGVYVAGAVRLFPLERRARIREVLHEMAHSLRWWLFGRLISMAVIAVMTGAGLWLIGVRLAFTLGLLAGTVSFVPYLGSISSAILALTLR
jgi:predicted PurR-regulated permease PerM